MARNTKPEFKLFETDAALIVRMKPVFEEIFTVWLEEGLAYERVAARLNVPLGTVKSRLHRARKKLISMRAADKEIA